MTGFTHQRQTRHDAPDSAVARRTASAPTKIAGGRVLLLQKTWGNARVAAMLRTPRSSGPRLARWTGDDAQSLTGLAESVLSGLKVNDYFTDGRQADLADEIYERYGEDEHQARFAQRPAPDDYLLQIQRAADRAGADPDLEEQEGSYVHFKWDTQSRGSRDRRQRRRMAVNATPDTFVQTVENLLTAVVGLGFVSGVKVPWKPSGVERKLDNILIYFDDDVDQPGVPTRAAQLAAALGGVLPAAATRPQHPAGMTAVHGEGVAIADQSLGGSYGTHVAEAMAEAIFGGIETHVRLDAAYVARLTLANLSVKRVRRLAADGRVNP